MKKLEKILCWFFDSDWGFLILILGYMGLMWLLWSLHWDAIYTK